MADGEAAHTHWLVLVVLPVECQPPHLSQLENRQNLCFRANVRFRLNPEVSMVQRGCSPVQNIP
jgi:hypothetical protein